MATTARAAEETGDFLVLEGVSWRDYVKIAKLLDGHNLRMTYLDGRLELMSPLPDHERIKERFGLAVRLLAAALGMPLLGMGSTTFRRKKKEAAKEPDTCFYLGDHATQMSGKKRINLRVDPPPDLAVEVVITHRDTEALATYARLRVPEVWWFEGGLRVYHLNEAGDYEERPDLRCFPGVEPATIARWVLDDAPDDTAWLGRLQGWVGDEVGGRQG